MKKAALGQHQIDNFSADRAKMMSCVECHRNSSTKFAIFSLSIDGGSLGLAAAKRQTVRSPFELTNPNRDFVWVVAWLALTHLISVGCVRGSDVIIWPVDAENAKRCFRPSGEMAMKAAGDTATVSGERRSHLTRESVMRQMGRPS